MTPAEPDWKAVAQIAIQQRDRAEAKANNLELDLTLAQQREAVLKAWIADLVPSAVAGAAEPG